MPIPASPDVPCCKPQTPSLPRLNSRGQYECPECGGTGFVEIDSRNFAYCSCRPIIEGLARLRRQGLLAAAQRMTFDAYQADAPWQRTLLERTKEFAAQDSPAWLFIGGQSGCGKTHLCTAAVTQRLLAGSDLRYMRWMNETSALKSLSLDPERGRLMREFISAPLLYIDDLFKLHPSPADVRLAFEILSSRCDDPTKITVISSERTLPEITQIDEAVGGRIYERCAPRYLLNIGRDPARNYRFRAAEEI